MVNIIYLFSFVETARKFIIAELSIRKLGYESLDLLALMKIRAYGSIRKLGLIRTDEDPSLRIESSAKLNLRGVSTKLNNTSVVLYNTSVVL